jgi:hypothetical protein
VTYYLDRTYPNLTKSQVRYADANTPYCLSKSHKILGALPVANTLYCCKTYSRGNS